jgi:hypothetical protein
MGTKKRIMRGFIDSRELHTHLAHVRDRKNGIQHLSLLAMMIAFYM